MARFITPIGMTLVALAIAAMLCAMGADRFLIGVIFTTIITVVWISPGPPPGDLWHPY